MKTLRIEEINNKESQIVNLLMRQFFYYEIASSEIWETVANSMLYKHAPAPNLFIKENFYENFTT